MNSSFCVCKYKKIKKDQYYPSHISPGLSPADTELSSADAMDVIMDMNERGQCCFMYPHATQGIILYKCVGPREHAISIGYITGTEGFYYVTQDPVNPLRILAFGRKPPSNFVYMHEYVEGNERPAKIDLNPPPHDKKTGVYTFTNRGLQLEYTINLEDLDARLFNENVYYIQGTKLYKITPTGKRKPYSGYKDSIIAISMETTLNGLVVRIEQLNGQRIIDYLDHA